jgi:hypothetical protein
MVQTKTFRATFLDGRDRSTLLLRSINSSFLFWSFDTTSSLLWSFVGRSPSTQSPCTRPLLAALLRICKGWPTIDAVPDRQRISSIHQSPACRHATNLHPEPLETGDAPTGESLPNCTSPERGRPACVPRYLICNPSGRVVHLA